MKKLLLLYRDPSDLLLGEALALRIKFGNCELVRFDPKNADEHAAYSRECGNADSLHPLDNPMSEFAGNTEFTQFVFQRDKNKTIKLYRFLGKTLLVEVPLPTFF